MATKNILLVFALALSLSLTSCSGLKTKCTTNCGPGGTASVTLTISDTPPSGALFLNFDLPIASMTLTPSGGGADVTLLSTPTAYEATRLASDSRLVGTFSVAAGTYTALNIFVTGAPSGVWSNSQSTAAGGCAAGAVCNLSGTAPGKLTVDLVKALGGSGLVLTANQNAGVGLEFNLNNAITTTGGITMDLKQPNVFTVATLPRTNQATGTLDTIQDFTGTVTAISTTSITVQSALYGKLVAALSSTTNYNQIPNLPNPCSGSPSQACIQVNSTVSVDANVGTDGSIAATEVNIIDITGVDELEGTIYPTTTAGVFGLIVNDANIVSSNTVLKSIVPGTGVFLSLTTSPLFSIDAKNFPIGISAGFSGSGDIVAGQVVRAQITAATQDSQGIHATAGTLVLRFTRLTGTVGTTTPTSTVFYLDNSTLNPFYGNFLVQPQVQTYNPQTILDGVANLNSLTAGNSVSISTLFLNPTKATPPFLATKVRKH